MYTKLVVLIIAAVIMTGCSIPNSAPSQAQAPAWAEGLAPESELGVTVNENFRVVDIDPTGAASLAGILEGDTLIDVTGVGVRSEPRPRSDVIEIWEGDVPTVEPVATENTAESDGDAGAVAGSSDQELPAPIATDVLEGTTLAFAESSAAIKGLIARAETVIIRLDRAGVVMTIEVKPAPWVPRPESPTPTPVMAPLDYF